MMIVMVVVIQVTFQLLPLPGAPLNLCVVAMVIILVVALLALRSSFEVMLSASQTLETLAKTSIAHLKASGRRARGYFIFYYILCHVFECVLCHLTCAHEMNANDD